MLDSLVRLKMMVEERRKGMDENLEEHKEYVGELPLELHKKLAYLKREKERLELDISVKQQEMIVNVFRKLQELFDARAERLKQEHIEIWNDVYQIMRINPKESYFEENGSLYRVTTNKFDEFPFDKRKQ